MTKPNLVDLPEIKVGQAFFSSVQIPARSAFDTGGEERCIGRIVSDAFGEMLFGGDFFVKPVTIERESRHYMRRIRRGLHFAFSLTVKNVNQDTRRVEFSAEVTFGTLRYVEGAVTVIFPRPAPNLRII